MTKEDHLYEAHKDLQGQGLIQPRVLMAMDEYAKELAIGFAEWVDNRGTRNDKTGLWIHNLKEPNTPITSQEIFDLYIQSKGEQK